MKFSSAKFRYPFLLTLILLFAEFLINPIREFPLNDDWSYAKSVAMLLDLHEINIGTWGAMTLATHVLWGGLFAKVFGFSFTILRISTLISSLIGLIFLYDLVKKISGSEKTGFVAALVLLFNPQYFYLSNTFMTDVNFNTLLLMFIYFAFQFFNRQSQWYGFVLLIVSVALVLLRQFGLAAPLALIPLAVFVKENKLKTLLIFVLIFLAAYCSLKAYEWYLKTYLESWAAYKFSGGVKYSETAFLKLISSNFIGRFPSTLLHVLVFSFPFAVYFLIPLYRSASKLQVLLALGIAVLVTGLIVPVSKFPVANLFDNFLLGPETFYQSWRSSMRHNISSNYLVYAAILKYLGSGVTLIVLSLSLIQGVKNKTLQGIMRPFPLLLISFCLVYFFLLCVSESFFDRYLVPLQSIALIGIAGLIKTFNVKVLKVEMAFLVIFVYVCMAGTRDYFTWNEVKWQAYHDLRKADIPTKKINGGFEINCWNEGQYNWWFDFADLKKFDYLIQYDLEPGFRPLLEYPFKRYFPPRQDKMYIFVRERAINKK